MEISLPVASGTFMHPCLLVGSPHLGHNFFQFHEVIGEKIAKIIGCSPPPVCCIRHCCLRCESSPGKVSSNLTKLSFICELKPVCFPRKRIGKSLSIYLTSSHFGAFLRQFSNVFKINIIQEQICILIFFISLLIYIT